jgi:hypothetical protein
MLRDEGRACFKSELQLKDMNHREVDLGRLKHREAAETMQPKTQAAGKNRRIE